MRVILVGSPAERDRLRARLPPSIEVAGEAPTLTAARRASVVDGILVASGLPDDGGPRALVDPLTARELDVLRLLVDGLSNKAIGARLGIGDQTVKFHVAAICGKLQAANRTVAVRRAIALGIVAI